MRRLRKFLIISKVIEGLKKAQTESPDRM